MYLFARQLDYILGYKIFDDLLLQQGNLLGQDVSGGSLLLRNVTLLTNFRCRGMVVIFLDLLKTSDAKSELLNTKNLIVTNLLSCQLLWYNNGLQLGHSLLKFFTLPSVRLFFQIEQCQLKILDVLHQHGRILKI